MKNRFTDPHGPKCNPKIQRLPVSLYDVWISTGIYIEFTKHVIDIIHKAHMNKDQNLILWV